MFFKNRSEAGRQLAKALEKHKKREKTIVLGLPRGGVVVAYEIATMLHLPLDVVVPRKLGAPNNPELAIGAIAEDEAMLDHEMIAALGVSKAYIESEIAKKKEEAARRLALFREHTPSRNWAGWTVLLIDDGIATGWTMLASIAALKKKNVAKIIVAVPVGSPESIESLRNKVDEIVCLYAPPSFSAVGQFYEQFTQTCDEEVLSLLNLSRNY